MPFRARKKPINIDTEWLFKKKEASLYYNLKFGKILNE